MANKKRKKAISKTQKSLQNKVYYLNRKNKKVKETLTEFNPDTFYKINSKKVKDTFNSLNFKQTDKIKGSTLINILRNEITKNNTVYEKVFKQLKNRFKKNVRGEKKQNKTRKKGLIISPPYNGWEFNQAVEFMMQNVPNSDIRKHSYIPLINAESFKCGSDKNFQMTYDKENQKFDVYLIENNEEND